MKRKRQTAMAAAAALLAAAVLLSGCSTEEEKAPTGADRVNGTSQSADGAQEEKEGSGNAGGQAGDSLDVVDTRQLAGELKEKYADQEQYAYAEPMTGIPRDQTFSFTIGFDPEEKGMTSFSEIVEICEESDLTHPVPFMAAWDEGSTDTFTIRPPRYGGLTISSLEMEGAPGYEEGKYHLFDQGEGMDWGNRGTLYMVQKVDLETGEPLEKPVVTVLTVQGELDTPSVSFSTTEDGRARFSWEPVEGAEQYYLLELNRSEDSSFRESVVIGSTDGTEWTAPSSETGGDVFGANSRFRTFLISEDDWKNPAMVEQFAGEYDPADGPVRESAEYVNSYGVIAVSSQGTSMISEIFSEDDLAKLLPYSLAYQAEKESEDGYSAFAATVQTAPAYRWIVMCDGRLSQRLIEYRTEEAFEMEGFYAEIDDEGNVTDVSHPMQLEIPYTVEGTPFTGSVRVENYSKGTWKKDLEDLAERQESLRSRTGSIAAELRTEEVTEETELPETVEEYPVTANSALSEYLAIHMLNGVPVIDLSEFPESADLEILTDAWEEAYYQNPLILGVDGVYVSADRKSLRVEYQDTGEERERKQQEIVEAVGKAAEQILEDGMSDLEKELAINAYLCEQGEYDDAALENAEQYDFQKTDPEFNDSFTPYGILVNGKGVCASYAGSFKLLADAAGLNCIVTTGYLDGSLSHAWNRVKINGAWQTVDSTNNDNDMVANALLNMPDSAIRNTLVEDTSYVLDSCLGEYTSDLEEDEYYHLQDRFFDPEEIAEELADGLEKEGEAVLRTEYDLNDQTFYVIANQVMEKLDVEELQGFYWMGVIWLAEAAE